MAFISQLAGYWFLLTFGIIMILLTYFFAKLKKSNSKEDFLVAGRNVNWFFGGASIAASWIWAPALFISVQLAYEKGLAGIFWFTFPNIIALLIFAFLAPVIRNKMPKGYTLPQYIKHRLQSERAHKMYLFPYLFYQLMAVTVQIFAGGSLVYLLTGIPLIIIMPILLIIALVYTYISGLKASIITDFIQMSMIIVIGAIIIPMTWLSAGGTSAISAGLGGLAGIETIFDPGVAFSLGIVTAIGLIAGAISDQQYWQRAFAIKKNDLVKAFIFGAVLFGIVPIALSTLGFLGANPALGITLPAGVDTSMIGIQTVVTLLPSWAVFLFVVMLLSGISSTLDSGLCAASSLWVTDIAKSKDDAKAIKSARNAMFGISVIGLFIALAVVYIPQFGLFHLWWIFNTIAACIAVPTVLSLYWSRLSAKGVLWGVITAFIIGLPLFIYGNFINNEVMIVGSTLFIIFISTLFCLVMPRKTSWKEEPLKISV
ncbi:MAG: Na+/proline symporter [Candidatus Woesearchaeota archaeon]|jgi:Na+/proline symporter